MTEFLDIDGSVLEGGGQILRISISLSAILGVPVRVSNIRAGRSRPGLAAQHLKDKDLHNLSTLFHNNKKNGIELVAEMCQAKLSGAHIGSTEIEFAPGKIKGGHYVADTRTAGSVSLLLQVALPCALVADGPVTLELRGGTNADMAPQIDYIEHVFRPLLKRFGAHFTLDIKRRGYFPKGGGHVTVDVTPVRSLRGVSILERGDVTSIRGASFVAGVLPVKMAHEMTNGAISALNARNVNIRSYKEDRNVAPDNCSGIIIWAELSSGAVLGADGLGRRGAEARALGAAAGAALRGTLAGGACVDEHAQDQIILYMALAEGLSSVRAGDVTLHTKTAMHVAELITKIKFDVRPENNHNIIECTGLGYLNKYLPPA